MKKILALYLTLSAVVLPIEAKPINKVVWLTTASITQPEIANARRASGGSEFHYFKLDESEKIRAHFEGMFPKSLRNKTESEKNAYLSNYIVPRLKAYTPEMMRSEMGVTLAKMYRITRIPAVVINDKYITYGLSVKDSIKAFNEKLKQ